MPSNEKCSHECWILTKNGRTHPGERSLRWLYLNGESAIIWESSTTRESALAIMSGTPSVSRLINLLPLFMVSVRPVMARAPGGWAKSNSTARAQMIPLLPLTTLLAQTTATRPPFRRLCFWLWRLTDRLRWAVAHSRGQLSQAGQKDIQAGIFFVHSEPNSNPNFCLTQVNFLT